MAKKKNPSKKHKFKHVEQSTPSAETATRPSSSPVFAATPRSAGTERDFSYVMRDLRRIGFMAGFLIVLELVLAYLIGNTALGTAVYRLIQF